MYFLLCTLLICPTMQHTAPSIDIKNNPFFCPAVPAHNFLASLTRNPKTFRSKEYKYRGKRFILRPFAAALDKCLFRGGGDSEDEKRTNPVQHESGTESSEGEVNDTFGGHFEPHISTLNATGRGLACVKSTLLRTGRRRDTGDSFGSDSFVTVPLVERIPCSGTATLTDRSGRPLITIQRNHNLAPHTLTLQDKLSSEHGPPPSPRLKRKSSESNFTYESGTKRARSTLSIDDKSFYVTLRREKLNFIRTPSTSPLAAFSDSSGLSPQRPVENNSFEELRAGAHVTVPRLKSWHGPVENIPDLDYRNMTDLAGALQGACTSCLYSFPDFFCR